MDTLCNLIKTCICKEKGAAIQGYESRRFLEMASKPHDTIDHLKSKSIESIRKCLTVSHDGNYWIECPIPRCYMKFCVDCEEGVYHLNKDSRIPPQWFRSINKRDLINEEVQNILSILVQVKDDVDVNILVIIAEYSSGAILNDDNLEYRVIFDHELQLLILLRYFDWGLRFSDVDATNDFMSLLRVSYPKSCKDHQITYLYGICVYPFYWALDKHTFAALEDKIQQQCCSECEYHLNSDEILECKLCHKYICNDKRCQYNGQCVSCLFGPCHECENMEFEWMLCRECSLYHCSYHSCLANSDIDGCELGPSYTACCSECGDLIEIRDEHYDEITINCISCS